jgi:hypothetical protein
MSSESPPVFARWLWQVTQYWLSSARWAALEANGVTAGVAVL